MKSKQKHFLIGVIFSVFVLAASPFTIQILRNAFWITAVLLVVSVAAFVAWAGCYCMTKAVCQVDQFMKRQFDR